MPRRSKAAEKKGAAQSNKEANAEQNTNTAGPSTQDEPMDVDNNVLDFENAGISEDEEGGTRIGDIYIPPPVPPHCSTESKGPRLIITQIVNYNFKSYAQEVIVGPFHHRFTAIIGPNGSGKSNIIDSMLFVFGYRANKIRCKKISTLIHNSAAFPNVQWCSVQVHFEQILDRDDGSIETVPDSKFFVERRAYRDNSSYYIMNGRRVQFKDVAKLLKQHHVDLDHNRFLILQGEVESISLMKPKAPNENETGMLEYLEDIIGTTRYIAPLKQISECIDKFSAERAEKHNRCKLAEREMKDLEPSYLEAVKYLKEKNENQHTKNKIFQLYIRMNTKILEEYVIERDATFEELKVHDKALEEIQKERVAKEEEARAELKHFEDLEKKKEQIRKSLEDSDRKYTELQQTMQRKNEQRKQEKLEIEKNEKALVKLEKIPEANDKKIAENEKKIEDLTKQKDALAIKLKEGYEKVEKLMAPLVKQREVLDGEKISLQANVNEAKAEVAKTESDLKILKSDENAEIRKYQTLKSNYEETEESLKTKTDDRNKLQHRVPQLENECAIRTAQIKKLQQEESNLKVKLNALNADIREKSETMRAQQAQHKSNKVLAFLMRMKDEGKIPGILGRLGDLGGIPQKYNVAISMCCGRLDDIIVDTVDTATACINALKQFNIGRATFIALEKVAYLANHSGPIKIPAGALRLYDLIKVEDERVLPAFYFSLRDTLVADNLDEATRIAYGAKRFRTVTLIGEIIELAGTMSGGGRGKLISSRIGTEVRTKTTNQLDTSISAQGLEELEREAEQLQSQVNYSQQEQGRLEGEMHALRNQKRQAESDLQKLDVNIKSLERNLPELKKQLMKQKERMEQTTTDAAQVKTLEATIDEQKQKLKSAEQAFNKVEKKVKAVQEQIDKLHEENVKSVQKEIEDKKKAIGKLNGDIAKLNAEKTKTERESLKLKQKIESSREAIAQAEDDIRKMSTERDEWDAKSVQFGKDLKEAEEIIAKAKSQCSGVQKEIAKLQKQENENKLKRVEIEEKLQVIIEKVNKTKAQLPSWEAKRKQLKLEEIPGDSEPLKPLEIYTNEELDKYELQNLQYQEEMETNALKTLPKNMASLDDYIKKRDIYMERVQSLEVITNRRNELRQLFDNVRRKRYEEFMTGFTIITKKLKEMYQLITQGGNAELELVDSMDPFNDGITFSVRPPKKTWKNIANLSGGEKTLSSLSLVFALHYYKPSPLYFMDEIDAALDFKNISIVANYIKQRTKNAQFIIISLRSNMFELCDYVVGIYKYGDCTQSLCAVNSPMPMPLRQPLARNVPNNLNHSNVDEGIQIDANKSGTNATTSATPTTQSVQQVENNENSAPRYTNFLPDVESTARASQLLQNTQTNAAEAQVAATTTPDAVSQLKDKVDDQR